jgi:hypothetical protein
MKKKTQYTTFIDDDVLFFVFLVDWFNLNNKVSLKGKLVSTKFSYLEM